MYMNVTVTLNQIKYKDKYNVHECDSDIKDPILDKDSLAVASAPAESMPEATVAPPNELTASCSNLLCLL